MAQHRKSSTVNGSVMGSQLDERIQMVPGMDHTWPYHMAAMAQKNGCQTKPWPPRYIVFICVFIGATGYLSQVSHLNHCTKIEIMITYAHPTIEIPYAHVWNIYRPFAQKSPKCSWKNTSMEHLGMISLTIRWMNHSFLLPFLAVIARSFHRRPCLRERRALPTRPAKTTLALRRLGWNGMPMVWIYAGWWFGTWMLYDFRFSWECHPPNWRNPIFQRGRYTTNQVN